MSVKDEIQTLEMQMIQTREQLKKLRKEVPAEEVKDYVFKNLEGEDIHLSELFDNKEDLILVHNMGRSCPYCTLWADGFIGFVPHLESRAAFYVESDEEPTAMQAFQKSRNWNFKMISTKNTSFKKDMGYQNEQGNHPGVSTFFKNGEGKIFRHSQAIFGPGDTFCSVWHLFDLLKDGVNNWEPQYK